MSGCTYHQPYAPLCGRKRADPIHDETLPRPKGWHVYRDDEVARKPRPILYEGEEERLRGAVKSAAVLVKRGEYEAATRAIMERLRK